MAMDEPIIGIPTGGPPEPPDDGPGASGDEVSAAEQHAAEIVRAGTPVQVAYAGASRGPAFNSAVIAVTPATVALALRNGGRAPVRAVDREPLILVVRARQRLHAFDSNVTAIDPARSLLLVTPPLEARRPERRAAVRVPVGVPLRSGVWLDPRGGESPIQATVTDVSVAGLQLRSLRYVGEGAIVRLTFVLHPAERPVHVQGMVVGVEEEARTTALRVHVQLVEMPEDSRDQIQRFVDRAVARRKVA